MRLGDVASVIMGQAPPSKSYNKQGRGVPFVKVTHFSTHYPNITEWTDEPKRMANEGDVLICVVGKVGVTNLGIEAAIGRSVAAIRPKQGKINQSFLRHFLKSKILQLTHQGQGAIQKVLTNKMLTSMKIPNIPLNEQKRIATILDKAEQIKEASEKTEEMRKQFASALFLDMFGDPVLNTMDWESLPMTEIFEITTGKLDSNAAVEGGGYPFFTCAKEASQIDHFAFDCECLLLAGNNASGDFDVKYYNGKFNAYQRTYVLTTKKIEYKYAMFALEYQLKKLKQSSLGTNTRYLTMGIFKRMHIQIPNRDLQQQFSHYHEALTNSASQDEIRVDELLESTKSLMLMSH